MEQASLPCALLGLALALLAWLPGCRSEHSSSVPIAGVTIGAPCVDGRCAEGLSCHHERPGSAVKGRCQLEPGRCRSDWDCALGGALRCRRLGTSLGVCQDSGL